MELSRRSDVIVQNKDLYGVYEGASKKNNFDADMYGDVR